jgi:hypothetical protein
MALGLGLGLGLDRPLARGVIRAALVLALAAVTPRACATGDAEAYFRGDPAMQTALARGVIEDLEGGVTTATFHTGSPRFDGEWTLGTYQMAALGLAQVALAHPELKAELVPSIEACLTRLLAPETTAFGAEAWRAAALDDLASDRGHAYLGYINLALGMLRVVEPRSRFAGIHDRLTEALARRMARAPRGLIETYPGEAYPADVASVIGSIGLHDRAAGSDHRALLAAWEATFRARWIDPRSGMIFQSGDAQTGLPRGPARASHTALAVYALSFALPDLSRDLFAAIQRSQRASLLGFGAIREDAKGLGGSADIDSGPVVLGVGVSATGFTLAGARLHGDRALYTELYRTADLFGAPHKSGDGRRFVSGGPLGDAILLAMLTASPLPSSAPR